MAIPNAGQQPKVGLFTNFFLPKAITVNGQHIALTRIDRVVQLLEKLLITNVMGNRFSVTQEGEDTALQAPEFRIAPCKLERLFSTGVVALTVWVAQRLAGRKGMAYAALGQLGLGLLTTLYHNKLSTGNRQLKEVYNHQQGREAAQTLKVSERPDQSQVSGFLSRKLDDPVQAYLESYTPDVLNQNIAPLKAGFDDLFSRDMVSEIVGYLCQEEFGEEKHNSVRAQFVSFMATKLTGQPVEILRRYIGEIASARVDKPAGQINVLKMLLLNKAVVSDLKFVSVLQVLTGRGITPQVQAVAFEVASQRLGGNISEVMKIFIPMQLLDLTSHLDAASLEQILGSINGNRTDFALYESVLHDAAERLSHLVAKWDDKDALAALIKRYFEVPAKFEGCVAPSIAAQQLAAAINNLPLEDQEGTTSRYNWLLREASVDVLRALPFAHGKLGTRINGINLSALFNELSGPRKAAMLQGVMIPEVFTHVHQDFLVNVLKVLTSDEGKSTPMATALLKGLTGMDVADLAVGTKVWLFAAVTKAKVGAEPTLQTILVEALQAQMFSGPEVAVAIQQVYEEITSSRVRTALLTTFFGNEVRRYPKVEMRNADVMVFAMGTMYDVVKASSVPAKGMLLELAHYAATEKTTLKAFVAKLQEDYKAGVYRMTAVLHTALNVDAEIEAKEVLSETKQGVSIGDMSPEAREAHLEELRALENTIGDLHEKRDLRNILIDFLQVEVPAEGNEQEIKQAAWNAFADRSWFYSHA